MEPGREPPPLDSAALGPKSKLVGPGGMLFIGLSGTVSSDAIELGREGLGVRTLNHDVMESNKSILQTLTSVI